MKLLSNDCLILVFFCKIKSYLIESGLSFFCRNLSKKKNVNRQFEHGVDTKCCGDKTDHSGTVTAIVVANNCDSLTIDFHCWL